MKKLLLPLVLLVIFLSPQNVFASDLDVSCGTSYCTLSSHDPIFSTDTKWVPGKSVAREVVIENTDTENKEVFIKARDNEASTNELDSYMNIILLNGITPIWQGTLAEFINAGNISLANLSAGDEYALDIEAEMASVIPNNMMGKSSVFNFSFGFEGENIEEQSSDESNSDSSNANSSGSDSNSSDNSSDSTGGTSSENPNLLASTLDTFFGIFTDVEGDADAATVAGEKKIVEDEKDVKGAGVKICRENYLWVLFVLAQILYGILFVIKKYKEKLKLLLAGHSILFIATIIIIYIFSCMLWPILISTIVFLTPIIYLIIKNRKQFSVKINS